jgi:5-methylcytosine-specific restriction endonuclease McrA
MPRRRCANPDCRREFNGLTKHCSTKCATRRPNRVGYAQSARSAPSHHTRDQFRDPLEACRWCGRDDIPFGELAQHHVVYRHDVDAVRGDRWHPDNALALCNRCHRRAHARRDMPMRILRPANLHFARDLLQAKAAPYLAKRYGGAQVTAATIEPLLLAP